MARPTPTRPPRSPGALPRRIVAIDADFGARVQVELAASAHPLDLQFAGHAADGVAGAELVEAAQPDIVVMGAQLPGIDGPEALDLIRHLAPRCHVVVRSDATDAATLTRCIERGACGHVRDTIGTDELAVTLAGIAKRLMDAPRLAARARRRGPERAPHRSRRLSGRR